MLFTKKTKPGNYEIVKEGQEEVMWINYNNYPYLIKQRPSGRCFFYTIQLCNTTLP